MTSPRPHLLTVSVEDFFHSGVLGPCLPESSWSRFEPRVVQNTRRALDLIERHGATATFFVLGWVARRHPELVREIVERGHEVAAKGTQPWHIEDLDDDAFREDCRRARVDLEAATGRRVLGFRVPQGYLRPRHDWALEVLADEGYVYDSSFKPRSRDLRRDRRLRFPHIRGEGERSIREFPATRFGSRFFVFPHAGGNWVRQIPRALMRVLFADWERRYQAPFNLYFHVWELDPELPRIDRAGPLRRIRSYRNLDKMTAKLEHYLERYQFESVASYLRREGVSLPETLRAPSPSPTIAPLPRPLLPPAGVAEELTLVVPCYQEEGSIPFLSNALQELDGALGGSAQLHFVFVDDGSSDGTWRELEERFADWPRVQRVQHPENRGVAQAILTGIQAAQTDLVASIDSDCTYDPLQLSRLLSRMNDRVDVVTASPYHPDGEVVGVPAWRLVLSRTLSRLYGWVFRHRLFTYTSCFRVYRRDTMLNMELRNPGFLGVAEMLAHVERRNGRIVECPARLESRILGHSKMKTVRTIGQHLGLLGTLAVHRWVKNGEATGVRRAETGPPDPARNDQRVKRSAKE